MSYSTKFKLVFFTLIISATLEAIALGRQLAWSEPLKKWLCEPDERPPIPGIAESLSAVGGFELVVSIGIPLILGVIFFAASRSRLSLFFWLSLIALHLLNRYDALQSSNLPWGACGLHRDLVFSAILVDVLLVVIAVVGAAIGVVFLPVLQKWGQIGSKVEN